jgi:MFS superfamily sulfate permease-like transporter
VNGSPTKTQMVDDAGGRSQLSMLVTAGIVLIVLLWLTGPISYMPEAVLSSIVFLIGVELVDVAGMRRVLRWRRDEFWVAAVTAAVVVGVGVKQGIILAMVLSLLDHLRRSYHPHNTYLVRRADGTLQSDPVDPSKGPSMITPGLVIYRFGAIMYYANAERLIDDVRTMESAGVTPPEWLCLDADMVTDVDFSAGAAILDALRLIKAAGTTLVLARVNPYVRRQLDRYGVTEIVGADAYFDSIEAVVAAFGSRASS